MVGSRRFEVPKQIHRPKTPVQTTRPHKPQLIGLVSSVNGARTGPQVGDVQPYRARVFKAGPRKVYLGYGINLSSLAPEIVFCLSDPCSDRREEGGEGPGVVTSPRLAESRPKTSI
jgi:hypothetical protein